MAQPMMRRIVLHSRPEGLPVAANFRTETIERPTIGEGQMLVQNAYLGLAPSSRIRMSEIKGEASYAEPTPLGGVVYGQTLGRVIESRHPDYRVGETVVLTDGGWQEFSISNGSLTSRVAAGDVPDTLWLGALGVSGLTAYVGLIDVGGAKPSETVLVSAAAGAVGAMVGQIAKALGCRVVGVAGGAAKCSYIRDELGFDAAVDYRAADFADALRGAVPDGCDLFFDNVGGAVRDTVLHRMNNFGRIVVCGMIAEYNNLSAATGPSWLPILTKRLRVQGFLMRDSVDRQGAFEADVGRWISEGKIKIREHIVDGLANTPSAFIGMLSGDNFGKTLVRIWVPRDCTAPPIRHCRGYAAGKPGPRGPVWDAGTDVGRRA